MNIIELVGEIIKIISQYQKNKIKKQDTILLISTLIESYADKKPKRKCDLCGHENH